MNAPNIQQPVDPKRLAQRVTLVGMFLDIALGIAKIVVGVLSFSYGLIADGIHSLSDVVTDVLVLCITRISHEEPDDEHPYGHARFETLGTVVLGGMLIAVALLLVYGNIRLLWTRESVEIPGWPALVVAAISIFSKEWIFRYTRKVGEQLRSNLLIANAWHSRTDAFSSVVVLVGIAGSMLGYPWLDGVAAVLVGIIVGKIGWDLIWDSLRELVDTGVSTEQIGEMKETILSVEGVENVHTLRTRRMGTDVYLDVHIQVGPNISVSEGHQIGEWVSAKLLADFPLIQDVIYHIDPEDDDDLPPVRADSHLLPLRAEVIHALEQCWQDITPNFGVIRWTIHYLDSKIEVEAYLSPGAKNQIEGGIEADALFEAAKHLPWLRSVRVWS